MSTGSLFWSVSYEALRVSRRVLRQCTSRFSPHKFTQPQSLAALVLKECLGQDSTGRLLTDIEEVRGWRGLAHAPHYTTLLKAVETLAPRRPGHRFLRLELARARRLGLLHPRMETAAGDSTGLPTPVVRHHFRRRQKRRQRREPPKHVGAAPPRTPKWTVACDCRSHLIVAVHAERGLGSDTRHVAARQQALGVTPRRPMLKALVHNSLILATLRSVQQLLTSVRWQRFRSSATIVAKSKWESLCPMMKSESRRLSRSRKRT